MTRKSRLRLLLAVLAILLVVAVLEFWDARSERRAQQLFKQGVKSFTVGDYDIATLQFDEAIDFNPDHVYAYYYRGMTYAKTEVRGDMEAERVKAFADFNKAIQLKPDFADAFYARGLLYSRNDADAASALADFNETIRLEAYQLKAYKARSHIYKLIGEGGKARADLDKIWEIDLFLKVTNPQHRKAFALINKSTSRFRSRDANPVSVVRAVNHLFGLGKEGAIDTLRAYVRYAAGYGVDDSEAGGNFPEQEKLCWIIHLLFVPPDNIAVPPRPGFEDIPSEFRKPRFADYLSVEGGLPFQNTNRLGGRSTDPGYLVEWAARHARMRQKPIRPADDPITAADVLIDRKPQIWWGIKSHIRQQVWRSIAHLIPVERKKFRPGRLDDGEWTRFKQEAAKLKIRWSHKEQNYVVE